MLIVKTTAELQKCLKKLKNEGKSTGFVPTMGALHQGHTSLIRAAALKSDVTICSIFVNPTQFNDKADFEKYPVTISRDIEMLAEAGCNVLFLPSVNDIYPNGFNQKQKLDFGFIAQTLEGEFRPGHFDGMAQVVELLLYIVKPNLLFMGQKDYQQQLIVRKLISSRRMKTKLVVGPTLREKDGLAMSSRNVRLDQQARKLAVKISATLQQVKTDFRKGKQNLAQLKENGWLMLQNEPGIKPEYFEIRNANSLQTPLKKNEKIVALAAAYIGGVRLIDNMLLN